MSTVCLFVFMFIMSCYYVSEEDASEMQERIRVALEVDQLKFRSRLSDLNLDDDLMFKAIQPGNPNRLKNILMKALRGEDVNLMIIGGSHSAGGKLGFDEKTLDGLYFKVFAKWWNNTIGKATESNMKEFPLAIGDTGSYFFAYCYKTFLAEGEKIDIALIEISANDDEPKPLEQLTRQVLAYPSAPVVLYINLVSGLGLDPINKKIRNPSCINLESYGQTELARHYGITSLSLREILCRKETAGQWKVVFTNMSGSDGNHIGVKAHAQVAMMLIHYIKSVFEEVIYDVSNVPLDAINRVGGIGSSHLPTFLLIESETENLRKPLCWTLKSPDIFQNIQQPSLELEVIDYNGFTPCVIVRGQKLNVISRSKELRSDAQGGWCAWRRLSKLQLMIFVPPVADDVSFRSRSVTILTRHGGGEAAIWLDHNANKAIKIDSKRGHDRVNTIATRVYPGYHSITVMTIRKGLFMVTGVFVGPPDFQVS